MTPEGRIVAKIKAWLEGHQFFVLKFHGSPLQRAGIPDLLVIKDGRAYWLEVKRPGEKPTKLQEYMIKKLREVARCGCEVVHSVEDVEQFFADLGMVAA